jgi:hypothetical protein
LPSNLFSSRDSGHDQGLSALKMPESPFLFGQSVVVWIIHRVLLRNLCRSLFPLWLAS